MDPTAVRDQIHKVVSSQGFGNKAQLRRLLEILARNIDSQTPLTPNQVIQELWPAEVRTKRSSDVATEMNRLRHALDSYYSGEGQRDTIIISLPNRSVTAGDGRPEKRWIVAKPRGESEEPAPVQPPDGKSRFTKVASIVGLLAAVGIAAFVAVRMLALPEQPRYTRLEGSILVVMNADGKELWRKAFPEDLGPAWYYTKGLAGRIWIGDLEGKGHTSVLFVYAPAKPESHASTLICYSDQGKEKWRWTPGKELPELGGSLATYKTTALGVLKATDKRPRRIVVSSSHDIWWPNQIAILDANGKLLSEYWHSGRLTYMIFADMDGDGREEIVATGINNDYLQATLVVLDPERVFGASAEVRDAFQIHGMGKAQERLRLLFPRSDLNKALFTFNGADEPTFVNGNLRLTVAECMSPATGCQVWYEVDKNLHLIAAYPGDDFRSSHVRFYQNRKDNHPFTQEEQFGTFERVRCLVGCKSELLPVH